MPAPLTDARSHRLAEIIAAMAGRRVLVVGDVMLDRYLWGDVHRTSPEAPVPVVRLASETTRLGGAANVAANLAALRVAPLLIGVVGRDEPAAELRRHCEALGSGESRLVADPTRPTTLKTRVLALNQQLLRLDHELEAPIGESVARAVKRHVEACLREVALVVISDYGKGALTPAVVRRLIGGARRRGLAVVVDPHGPDYTRYRGASVIKPNKPEAEAASGVRIDSLPAMARAAQRLAAAAACPAVVISRGGDGVSVFERGKRPVHLAAQARAVYDVTGAGDSFVAAMSAALAAGATLRESAELGNLAGSAVVGKLGAASVEPRELMEALRPGSPGQKLRSPRQLRGEIEALRAARKRIVFTNGCFDLIHLGHIKFLEAARRLGDVLIVALNTDRSVRRIKGPPRPVLDEEARLGLLASLDCVDYLVLFDEDTPEPLLRQLRPDVLVKGKARGRGTVVGREIVERQGGRVELIPQLGDVETETLIARIAREAAGGRRKRSSAR